MADQKIAPVIPESQPSDIVEKVEVVAARESDLDEDHDEKLNTPDGEEPNELEKATLRHVSDKLSLSVWLVAIIEFCERFAYYGLSALLQNYVQRPLDGSLGRGALGLGHRGATALTTFFQFWCYITPVLGAIIADQYLGKYKTLILFCGIYLLGLVILLLTSLPIALQNGAGLGGFIAAVIAIGLGTGGIKSNVSPLIADQYTRRKMAVSTTEKGERVILDPAVTIQRIYMIFYCCINLGCLSMLATPFMERDVGFWSAYLMCTIVFCLGIAILVAGRKIYVIKPPHGTIITDAFKAIWMMIKARNMDAAKPTYQASLSAGGSSVTWDDHFVEELKRALVACKVFTFFPIFWVVYGQFASNFVSQAGQMAGHGIPNNFMQTFDPIAIIIAIPVLDRVVYPILRKYHIEFRPITRITLGFLVVSLAMMYAAIVQHMIYSAGPCYERPLCDLSIVNGVKHGNDVHIAIQAPAYMFIGIGEVFLSVTGLEYAYTKAPERLKSLVSSLFLLTSAFGAALGLALSPVAYDPAIKWMFVGLCITSVVTAGIFWLLFRGLNKEEDKMNSLDKNYTGEDSS
ncbi:peptide transporter ptr2 [Ophidiomyces ophidiicola]|nr:peptide transporter ptr2 [Ophidiomyces ophidiicola]